MNGHTRREFLKRLARGAAYAAPVVISVSAPPALAGQGKASEHKDSGAGDHGGLGPGAGFQQDTPLPPPPSRNPPPGGDPPGQRPNP